MNPIAKYLLASSAAAIAAHSGALPAQGYPDKPIRIVVPFSPGGGVDFVARLIGAKFRDAMKQAVIIDNRTGAGGNIAASVVARAAPDGYTILMGSASQAVNVSLHKKLPYDLVKDFAPITLITSSPQLLVVHPSVPAHSVPQLIALARSKPGDLTFASAGNGGAPHLAGELFKLLARIEIRHIPYKGGGSAMIDLVGGQVDLYFSSVAGAAPQVRAGKLRALAVTSARRLPILPDIPTVAEAALPGYQASNWYAFLAPAGTASEIVASLNAETLKALRSTELSSRLKNEGYEIIGSSPAELGSFINEEIAKNAKLIHAANIKVE